MGGVRDDRAGAAASSLPVAAGTLLVASPRLSDPNFRRTVVYMIEHRDHGSLGVVLNRPSELEARDVLPAWASLSSPPGSLFVGGPVDGRTALCLATLRTGASIEGVAGLVPVRAPVALVDLDADPAPLAPRLRGLRVFAGYAGWDAGQLAGEIDRGDWFVVPGLPDDVITPRHADLWGRVLRRQGTPLALLATFPAEIGLN
jgi:putative transcriptional regulator